MPGLVRVAKTLDERPTLLHALPSLMARIGTATD
jgi:hypothetical protein